MNEWEVAPDGLGGRGRTNGLEARQERVRKRRTDAHAHNWVLFEETANKYFGYEERGSKVITE